MKRLATG
ncbi:hypothetical protein D046_3947A, partial [Vibrio parahaemolyticus V-223/04]